jgi:23S rRNA (adenine2503-C2)-methyltransferase
VDQFLFWRRWLFLNKPEKRLTGAVIMGMGEPMMNYENVANGLRFLIDFTKTSAKHFAISTAGLLGGIKKMQADERLKGVRLALSLHAPNEELRKSLMPRASQECRLSELIKTMKNFAHERGDQVMIEYLMLDNVNDTEELAKELVRLLGEQRLFHINLIRYNSAAGEFEQSDDERIIAFQKVLRTAGFDCTRRRSYGTDIKGACGQLVAEHNSIE